MFDLKTIEAEKAGDATGTVIVLKDRDGDPYTDAAGKPVTMTVLGAFAAPVLQAKAGNKRRFIKALRRGEDDTDPNDVATINVGVAAVVAWHGVEAEGQPVPFTPANVREVLTQAPWILSQVSAAVENPKLFSTRASGNS